MRIERGVVCREHPACGRALEAKQPVSRTARAESAAAAPQAGLRSAAQYKKRTRELVEQLLAS